MKFYANLLIGCLVLGSCVIDDKHTPATTSASEKTEQSIVPATPEEALFVEKCAMCHRHHGMGTGLLARRMPDDQALLEKRTDLNALLIQTAVRQGIGTMPPISRAEVSDAQLRAIERHLIRHNDFNKAAP